MSQVTNKRIIVLLISKLLVKCGFINYFLTVEMTKWGITIGNVKEKILHGNKVKSIKEKKGIWKIARIKKSVTIVNDKKSINMKRIFFTHDIVKKLEEKEKKKQKLQGKQNRTKNRTKDTFHRISSQSDLYSNNQVVFQFQAVILYPVFGAEAQILQSVFPLCLQPFYSCQEGVLKQDCKDRGGRGLSLPICFLRASSLPVQLFLWALLPQHLFTPVAAVPSVTAAETTLQLLNICKTIFIYSPKNYQLTNQCPFHRGLGLSSLGPLLNPWVGTGMGASSSNCHTGDTSVSLTFSVT